LILCFAKKILAVQIRHISIAPPLLVFLSKNPICKQYDLSSLEFIMCGAAPAGKELCEEVQEMYKNIKYILQGSIFIVCLIERNSAYGMSEVTMATHLPDAILGEPFGSVGQLASNLEMKVLFINYLIFEKGCSLGSNVQFCLISLGCAV
ncbi:hypothetical protein COOONC_26237, partial [Cooperia oncophora]